MPGNCFYHHICQWCSQQETQFHMKMCSQCKLVSYCSVDHQKYDWVIHKRLCKAVDFIARKGCQSLFSFDGTTQETWNYHRTRFMCSVELFLKKKLEVFERQMILFPNVCNFCFKYNNSYNPCVDCYCVYYCCKEHSEEDSKEHCKSCKELKSCFDVDLFLKDGPISLSVLVPLNSKSVFPNNMKEYIEINYESQTINEKFLISEELSFVLTLIYILLKSGKNNLNTSSSITVHVIGAGERESEIDKLMEIFFHWLPQIKQIKMLLIGPECIVNPGNGCQTYKFKGKSSLLINKVNDKLYHEYITEPGFTPPCVVMAYNCGFSEFADELSTWNETIQCILSFKNVLFVTTSYNKKEAENDICRVVSNNVNTSSLDTIKCAERNPFRSLRPIRDWENRSQTFYVNNFISILNLQ
ncbi:uncharacterized protein [Rhodnius prolixus]|uniref:MYND-type domain-containing protein n=1 Tax=Rhodnius prolixus TaxID=13249 RepID=T1HBI7_RHOPR